MKPLDHLGPSLWAGTANEPPETVPLDGERHADVVIVGAGYTGLSCAIHLADAGADVVVLEAKGIGHGGSGRNMGQVNPGVWADPKVVEDLLGKATGRRFNEAFGRTYELVEGLVKRFDIRCDLKRTGNIYVAHSARGLRKVEDRQAQLAAYGFDVEMLDREQTAAYVGNRRYHGAMLDKRAGNIHPLNYTLGLAEGAISLGVSVHTGSRVSGLARTGGGWRAETDRGAVTAERAVIATDSYSDDLWPGLKRSLVPVGTYATATVPLGDNLLRTILPHRTSTFESAPISTYFHMVASNRVMISVLGYPPLIKDSWFDRWPRLQLRRHFPQAGDVPFEFKWGGTIGLSDDHLPRLHEPAPGLTIALGFSGRGITSATLGGRIAAGRALGTLPDDESPLPVKPIEPIPLRLLRAASYETGFRAFRMLAWLP